ncbi:MAG: nucleotidyltransferase domain-containing protein, partial [Euryarchaeota archaeon]|nr:nucleotidyltransferase domain-containing protein [Euryarchaeota archaeon]
MTQARSDLPKEEITKFCKKWGISEFSFFGSVLTDDFRPDSDIDVLVTFEEDSKYTLFDLVHIEDELKQIFGRDVDLLTRRGVEQSRNYIRRKSILSSLELPISRDMAHLLDILLAAKDARDFTAGFDKDAFLSDLKCQCAVTYCLEVIAEAVKRLSDNSQRKYPDIPWSVMGRVRDLHIPADDTVNLNEVWATVQDDAPVLISGLERIVPPEDE